LSKAELNNSRGKEDKMNAKPVKKQ